MQPFAKYFFAIFSAFGKFKDSEQIRMKFMEGFSDKEIKQFYKYHFNKILIPLFSELIDISWYPFKTGNVQQNAMTLFALAFYCPEFLQITQKAVLDTRLKNQKKQLNRLKNRNQKNQTPIYNENSEVIFQANKLCKASADEIKGLIGGKIDIFEIKKAISLCCKFADMERRNKTTGYIPIKDIYEEMGYGTRNVEGNKYPRTHYRERTTKLFLALRQISSPLDLNLFLNALSSEQYENKQKGGKKKFETDFKNENRQFIDMVLRSSNGIVAEKQLFVIELLRKKGSRKDNSNKTDYSKDDQYNLVL